MVDRAESYLQTAEPELRIARLLAAHVDGFIDVGANNGLYSALVSDTAPELPVLAFEPLPNLAARLGSALPGVDVRNMALSDTETEGWLVIPSYGGKDFLAQASVLDHGLGDGEAKQLRVAMSRLDREAADVGNNVLLKVDVEGHELEVLRGGEGLMPSVSAILVESEERHSAGGPQQIIDWCKTQGFLGWVIVGDQLFDAAKFDPAVHQPPDLVEELERTGKLDESALARYGQNFLFVRPDFLPGVLEPSLETAGFRVNDSIR